MKRTFIKLSVCLLIAGVVSVPAFAQNRPTDNARSRGVKTCIQAIERETGIFLPAGQQHVSHDFVSPGGKRDVDKRPFYSMSFRSYNDVGIGHITVTATKSYLGRRNEKCDLHVNETFVSPVTCEEFARGLAQRQFRASPLAPDVIVMENQGDQDIFPFYYLTSASQGGNCLVTRRRVVYEQ